MIGPKEVEVTGEWRKLHDRNDLYSSPNIVHVIKLLRMRDAGILALMEERKGVYSVLVQKADGKRPPGTPRNTWEDNN